jgi:hypothetical protein
MLIYTPNKSIYSVLFSPFTKIVYSFLFLMYPVRFHFSPCQDILTVHRTSRKLCCAASVKIQNLEWAGSNQGEMPTFRMLRRGETKDVRMFRIYGRPFWCARNFFSGATAIKKSAEGNRSGYDIMT